MKSKIAVGPYKHKSIKFHIFLQDYMRMLNSMCYCKTIWEWYIPQSLSYRGGSPQPSAILRGSTSRVGHHQRSASWRARNRRHRGDKTNLVVDSLSDSVDDADDDVFSSTHSQSPTYSAGMPRAPSVNTHGWGFFNSSMLLIMCWMKWMHQSLVPVHRLAEHFT